MAQKVLVLGGTGFIGRNLVKYLVDNNLASKIRVVDKKIPEMVGLSKTYADVFEKVDFKQVDLAHAHGAESAFEGEKFDVVINLAAETKLSLEPAAYHEGIVNLAVKVGTEAAKHGVHKFIQVSTAQVYESGSKAKDESGKLDPWTSIAKASLQAEQEVLKIAGLNVVIVRPAIVYGPADITGLAPRIVVAAVYKKLNKTMKLLWGGQLKINTVHVHDVVHALWFLVSKGENRKVYNLADKNDTDQEKVNHLMEKIFGIQTGFKGKITSQLATTISINEVTEEVNSLHIDPWAAICKESGLNYSRLTPYLDAELLENNSLSVDGSAIEKLGFAYQHPMVTDKLIREAIDEYIVAEWFPKNFV